jgi:hypothetical protein
MRTLYIIAFLGLGTIVHAEAQIVAIDTSYAPGSSYENNNFSPDDRVYGWKFTIGESAISVTDLGLFDVGQNGFADSHRVGIWDSGGNLLVDTIISAGTVASLDGNFRFVSVEPTTLNANGIYVIGALFPSGLDTAIAFAPAAPPVTSEMAYVSSVYSESGIFNPPLNTYPGNGIVGPNFKGELSAVPEPQHYALITGIALFALGCIRKAGAKRANPAAL